MPASAGHAVAYTISPIFKQIIDYVQLYFTQLHPNLFEADCAIGPYFFNFFYHPQRWAL